MRVVAGLVALSLLAAGTARADFGVRPTWTDFQPAVSTQYRPPEGGKRYPPPNTATLLRQEQLTPYDGPVNYRNDARANPSYGSTNPANKPPSQVGR